MFVTFVLIFVKTVKVIVEFFFTAQKLLVSSFLHVANVAA